MDPRSKGRGCFDGEGAFASDECEGDLRRGKGLAASGTLASVEGIKTTSAGIGGGVGERLGLMFVTLRFRASRCSKDDGSKCVSRCRRCQHATLAASRLYVRHLEVQFVNEGAQQQNKRRQCATECWLESALRQARRDAPSAHPGSTCASGKPVCQIVDVEPGR